MTMFITIRRGERLFPQNFPGLLFVWAQENPCIERGFAIPKFARFAEWQLPKEGLVSACLAGPASPLCVRRRGVALT